MTHKTTLLSVRDLHTTFELKRWGFIRVGAVGAVEGVSFDLHRGESIAIVGESGSGKSTLAKSILGLHPPSQGEVFFEGERIIPSKSLRAYLAQVGYVQQDPYAALPPFMNVRRILEEPLRIHGVRSKTQREEKIRQALHDVRLTPADEYLTKYPHMLSGGQQQRVVIARAIMMRPKLLVADEPVSMLDASVRVELLELLRQLRETYNLSMIYITHDLSTVRYFSDRILVMYGAKVVEEAPADIIVNSPGHPYTQALLAATTDVESADPHTLRSLPPGEPPSLLNPPEGCRFHPRCVVAIDRVCRRDVPPMFSADPKEHRIACWHIENLREKDGA